MELPVDKINEMARACVSDPYAAGMRQIASNFDAIRAALGAEADRPFAPNETRPSLRCDHLLGDKGAQCLFVAGHGGEHLSFDTWSTLIDLDKMRKSVNQESAGKASVPDAERPRWLSFEADTLWTECYDAVPGVGASRRENLYKLHAYSLSTESKLTAATERAEKAERELAECKAKLEKAEQQMQTWGRLFTVKADLCATLQSRLDAVIAAAKDGA